MLTDKGFKRIIKEISLYNASDKDNFVLSFDESNLQIFYAVVRTMDGDYSGGEYILKVKLPDDYPYNAPVISCETPNGRFKTGMNICLSISHFHSETWSPLLTVEKVLYSVISVFYDENILGIGSIKTSSEEKRHLARCSSLYNKEHHSAILSNIK